MVYLMTFCLKIVQASSGLPSLIAALVASKGFELNLTTFKSYLLKKFFYFRL